MKAMTLIDMSTPSQNRDSGLRLTMRSRNETVNDLRTFHNNDRNTPTREPPDPEEPTRSRSNIHHVHGVPAAGSRELIETADLLPLLLLVP